MSSLGSCPNSLLFGSFLLLWKNGRRFSMKDNSRMLVFWTLQKHSTCRVNHSLLLHKLAGMGISGSELAWFRTYLCGRSICTTVGGVRSPRASISSGVPQGSVLGLLLFVVYFSDLPGVVQAKCALFADDTSVQYKLHWGKLCVLLSASVRLG